MGAGSFIGRLGPLAAALGVGAAIAIAGTPTAYAEPADSHVAPVASARSDSAPGHRARQARTEVRTEVRSPARTEVRSSARTLARSAARTEARSPDRSPARTPAVISPAAAATVTPFAAAAASGPGGFLGGLATLFANQSPAPNPTQTGQSGHQVSGSLNVTDPDSDVLTYRVIAEPAHGTVTVGPGGGYAVTVDAAVAAAGTTDSFRVEVSDAGSGFHIHGLLGLVNLLTFGLVGSSGHTTTSTVAVNVAPFVPGNHPPTATVAVGSPNPLTGAVAGTVTGIDTDGDTLTYSAPATTAKGSVGINAVSGEFTYTPTLPARTNAAAPGATLADLQDSFDVTVADGHGGTAAVAVTVPVSPLPDPAGPLAAFPGAEGFGAYATGGRGGSVVYVTNLNAAGPGSLQWAIDQPGAKYILFKVSGLIDTQIHLTNGNVTIAGQTSPGGITIRGLVTDESPYQDQTVQAPVDFAENWILQHVRIRPGLDAPGDDGLRLRYTRNAIVDHVSIGNAIDEAIEISYSRDITVQNTAIAETVGGHAFYGGVLMNYSNPAYGFKLDNVSLHHSIFNRIEGRLPEGSRESLAAANSFMNLELSNNLYWDPRFFIELGQSTGVVTNAGGEPYPIYWNLNAVNNYFHTGSAFPFSMFDDLILRRSANQLYVSGNRMNLYPGLSDYQLFYCCNDFNSVTDPADSSGLAQRRNIRNAFPAITYTPTDQLRSVLLNTAGAWPRDPMDTRLLGFVAAGTISSAPPDTNPAGDALLPAYSGSAPAAPADTDSDGMPDAWEIANGLNPNAASPNSTQLSAQGYTDLEVYLQELSASRITGWSA